MSKKTCSPLNSWCLCQRVGHSDNDDGDTNDDDECGGQHLPITDYILGTFLSMLLY